MWRSDGAYPALPGPQSQAGFLLVLCVQEVVTFLCSNLICKTDHYFLDILYYTTTIIRNNELNKKSEISKRSGTESGTLITKYQFD